MDHILSGKAIARAVRAHVLVDAALNTLIASKAFNVDLLHGYHETYMEDDCEVEILNVPNSCNKVMEGAMEEGLPLSDGALCSHLKDARSLDDKLMAGSITEEEVSKSNILRLIKDSLYKEREALQSSKTAKLWIVYMDMVDISSFSSRMGV